MVVSRLSATVSVTGVSRIKASVYSVGDLRVAQVNGNRMESLSFRQKKYNIVSQRALPTSGVAVPNPMATLFGAVQLDVMLRIATD